LNVHGVTGVVSFNLSLNINALDAKKMHLACFFKYSGEYNVLVMHQPKIFFLINLYSLPFDFAEQRLARLFCSTTPVF
jgi:hypothetical protein